jgi:hypothetical protein
MAAIDTYAVTSSTAKAFRALNKYGMNLADFAALTTNSTFDGFGNGTGYTVGNWISDGVFANLAAVQAVYPIVQDGNDHVDWVLLQSAVDFMIYGGMGNTTRQNMKRRLFIPAGHYLINRTLHIGYKRVGTPPAALNGNGYVSVTIEGEGRQTDTSGNGMTGTTILTENYTYPGIVAHYYQAVKLKGFTLQGPGVNWLANNVPIRSANVWNPSAWNDPANSVAANQLGGTAVNVGIGLDLYSSGSVTYPNVILPASFGGGTVAANTFGGNGGTTVEIEDVNVSGFTVGIARCHGDGNGEFYRLKDVDISYCVNGFVTGHSQNRNPSLINVNFEICHTAMGSVGGLTGNANMHGVYQNIHIGRCFQCIDHPNADWSGALTIDKMYAESFFRIGTWNNSVRFSGCYFSFLEQEGTDGVTYNHIQAGRAVFSNCSITGLRHGLITHDRVSNGVSRIEITDGTGISAGFSSLITGHANATQINDGLEYMQGLFHPPGFDSRILRSNATLTQDGYSGRTGFAGPDARASRTFLDQDTLTFRAGFPNNLYPEPADHIDSFGGGQRFVVPKIARYQLRVDITARTDYDLTFNRVSINADIKADVGDVFAIMPAGGGGLDYNTYFVVISISGGNMVLRQLNNFSSTTATNYEANGLNQVVTGGAGWYSSDYICTRIKSHYKMWVGDVTAGSNVISNVRDAYRNASTDNFSATNFLMAVGDYYIHHEIERANTSGAALKYTNLVSAIDFTANTITLTENFNITRTAYPIVFYVKTYNA